MILHIDEYILCEKCPNTEFFLLRFGHFSHSDSYSSHLQSLNFIEDTPSSQCSLGSGPARLIPKILLPPKSFLL